MLFQDPCGHEPIHRDALSYEVRAVGWHPADGPPGSPLSPQAAGHRQRPGRSIVEEAFQPAVAQPNRLEGDVEGKQPGIPADPEAAGERPKGHRLKTSSGFSVRVATSYTR